MEDQLWKLFFDNLHTIFFPEEWIAADLSMSKMELLALFLLTRQDERMMSQLADAMNIPMSTATGIVSRLVKGEYVQRLQSEENRRVVTVCLTPKGRQVVSRFRQSVSEFASKAEALLTQEEKQVLFGIVDKVLVLMKNPDNAPDSAPAVPVQKISIE